MGDHPERLLELLPRPGRAALVISNACDGYTPDDRAQGVERELVALQALGLEPRELDLRACFGRPAAVAAALADAALVWTRGGNTFLLRHALAESGADAALVTLLEHDALAYGGYSAGVCVLGPSLRGLELADEPGEVQRLYGVPARWDGLGLIPFAVVPHCGSPDHPETEACERLAEHYRSQGVEHRKLRDGQAIVVNGEHTEIV